MGLDLALGERGDERGDDGDAGGGSVLGDRTLRHVDVEVPVVKEVRIDAIEVGVALDILEGEGGALLHHRAEVAGHAEPPLARGDGGTLHEEDHAADAGPGETGDDTGVPIALILLLLVLLRAEQLGEIGGGDGDGEEGAGPHAILIFLSEADLVTIRIVAGVVHLQCLYLRSLGMLHRLLGELAEELTDALVELTHTALEGIVLDQTVDGALGELHVALPQPDLVERVGDQVSLGDLHLLLRDVAAHLDHLHTVTQGAGDVADVICRGDEECPAEVVVEVEVIVVEGIILLRVEHLEEGAGGVALVVVGELVHLIKDEDGIARAGLKEALDDPSRHRPYVGAAVTADLRLIVHATEGDPDILPSKSAGDALAEGGLAHSGRAVEAEYRCVEVALELQYREMLKDALLDLLEAEVVLVEDALGGLDIEVILRHLIPGQVEDRLAVLQLDAVVRALGAHMPQLGDLLVEGLAHLGGPLFLSPLGEHRRDLVLIVVGELLADLLHLLLEEVVPLLLIHLALRLMADLLPQGLQLSHLIEEREEEEAALLHVRGEEEQDLLLLLLGEIAGAEVDDHRRVLQSVSRCNEGLGHVALEDQELDHHLLDRHGEGAILHIALVRHRLGAEGVGGLDKWGDAYEVAQPHAHLTLHHDGKHPVAHIGHMHHLSDDAVVDQVLAGRLLNGRVLLRRHKDMLILRRGEIVEETLRLIPADDERHRHVGEELVCAHRQERQHIRQLADVLLEVQSLVVLRQYHRHHLWSLRSIIVLLELYIIDIKHADRQFSYGIATHTYANSVQRYQ